jgi:hypothetical protein
VSVPLPWNLQVTNWLSVTKLASNGRGGTDVVCSFARQPLPPFTLDRDVDLVGADTLRGDIEDMALDLISKALELSQ